MRNTEQDSDECIVSISNLVIPPRSELIITYSVKKSMMQFESYTNDSQRGFNVMHTPILYRETDRIPKNDPEGTGFDKKDIKERDWRATESTAMLVQIPEPDFSMVFNVNGVTFGLLGVFFVNMYNSLVKPKRFLAA